MIKREGYVALGKELHEAIEVLKRSSPRWKR